MKLGRCPICHSNLHLDALMSDDAARELLALLGPMAGGNARALLGYIGLFRPAKSDLTWKRALKLTKEAQALSTNPDYLRVAMEQTTQKIREARAGGQARALTNHNYLKKVLESLTGEEVVAVQDGPKQPKQKMEIFNQSQPESLEETTRKWQEQMERYRRPAGEE